MASLGILALLGLSACSSDTDTITLGNGLTTEVATDATASTAEDIAPGFLGSAELEPADENNSDNADADADAPDASAVVAAPAGIGGSSTPQPLDDEGQADQVEITPGIGAANPAEDQDSIDLSNDILIPPDAPDLTITAATGELVFAWETPDPNTMEGEFTFGIDLFDTETRELMTVVSGLDATTIGYRMSVTPHLFNWENNEFILSICTVDDCLRSFNTQVSDLQSDTINRVQSDNTREFDFFGSSLTTAANGQVLLAGIPGHDASSQDSESSVDNDDDVFDAGAAELFFEVDNEWFSAAELQQPTPGFNSQFGFAVASDASGDTIVVGAPSDSSQQDLAGAAYVFIRAGETWIQSAVLAPGLTRAFSQFGHSVAISDDAQLIAVGAPGDPNATIDPFAPVESEIDAGSVTLFRFDEASGNWILSDYVRSPTVISGQRFGESIALNEAASTMVVTAPGEVAGELRAMPGVVHIFEIESAGVFARQQLFQFADSQQDPERSAFGSAIAISADGSTIVATCLNRPQSEISTTQLNKPQSEIVVYNGDVNTTDSFTEQYRLTPAGEHGFDTQLSLALSADGNKIATGLTNPDSGNNTVTVYQQSGLQESAPEWEIANSFQQPEDDTVNFASSIEFSTDGAKLFIGAEQAAEGGSVYVY